MSELKDLGLGIPGPEHLREALTNCTDPLATIEDFQEQNGILLPSLRPALPFLDLHGVARNEFHQTTMEELRDKLIARIAELALSPEKDKFTVLNDLLKKSFPVIKIKSLQPIVMSLLQHLPKIKPEYLNAVMEDPELYKVAAVEVKQQIWQDNQALFGDEVSPLLTKYIDNKETVLFNGEQLNANFFTQSPKSRRQEEVVQQLTKMVGKNVKLYDMVLQFLRTLFLRTRNVHYCTLRAEMLMTLHDLEVHEICSVDPCHKFTWCLDACIRERFIDSKRAKELQGFLDSVRRGREQVLGDLSMILCDPHATNTITLSAVKAMQQAVTSECLPRSNDELILLLRMLALGLGAWGMIDSQMFKEPKLDVSLVTRLLPSLLSVMVDDQISIIDVKLLEGPHIEPMPDYVLSACRDQDVACNLAVYYCMHVMRQKDSNATCRLLRVLANCANDIVYQDTILHQFVSYLAGTADSFSSATFCTAVFDEFFLPNVSRESVLRHLLRLLCLVFHRVAPPRMAELMALLAPTPQRSESVHAAFRVLSTKLLSYQSSPVAEPEKLDSPLMRVPAPTPAPI